MTTKIAINGFGRIGRLVLRTLLARHREELTVVAVNDMADLQTNAHLFRYDTTYGIFPGTIEMGEGVLRVDGQNIAVLNLKEPGRLPWRQLGVDIVIEATGVFTDAAHVRGHLDAGAKKAIITAPAMPQRCSGRLRNSYRGTILRGAAAGVPRPRCPDSVPWVPAVL